MTYHKSYIIIIKRWVDRSHNRGYHGTDSFFDSSDLYLSDGILPIDQYDEEFPPPTQLDHFSPTNQSRVGDHSSKQKEDQPSEATNSSPFPVTMGKNCLASFEIKKCKLIPAERVVSKFSKMKTESKIGTLAVKLARQSFFGDDVMKRCTVQGVREFPGLPCAELGQLKEAIFNLFPQYWRNPAEFEPLWSTCVESVGQACKPRRS